MKSLAVCALLALLALPAIPAAALEPYLVKDVEPATTTAGSNPADLVTFSGAVLFFADDGSVSGRQLWRTDGTAAGTYRLSDFRKDDYPAPFLATERLYFFRSYDSLDGVSGLWVSDGTPAGTFRLTGEDVDAGSQGLFAARQGILYFMASDPEHGAELWRSDGTPAGTHIVADVSPGPGDSDIRELTEYRGLVWFNMHGNTIWRTNGTAAGTALAIDPDPSSAIRNSVEYLQVLRGRLVFFAPPRPGESPQLWAGDGTARGTRPITGLPRRGTYLWSSSPVATAGKLYFYVWSEAAGEDVQTLWVSDGTRRGTRVLSSAPLSRLNIDLFIFAKGMGNRLFFLAERRGYGHEPWVTDGTPGGTRMLQDVCPGPCSSFTTFQEVFDGQLYFTASPADALVGAGLWSTDGTPEGTSLVNELCRDDCVANLPSASFVVGNRLVFVERAGDADAEVWSTDGTGQGTVQITDFEPMVPWRESGFQGAVLNRQLLFNADDGEHGQELWRTDGTRAGTEPVADLNRSILGVSSSPRGLMSVKAFGPEELDGAQPVLRAVRP